MTILEAIFLGIIQGATEFLPISSSGHLLLIPALFNLDEPSLNLISITHLGTLLAVLIYFRQDIGTIIQAVIAGLREKRPLATPEARLGWYVVVGSIPIGIVGLYLAEDFDALFGPRAAAYFLLGTAAILVIGEWLHSGNKPLDKMTWTDALVIGVIQMLAVLPGISRSGTTIMAGLTRGLDRTTAARYSFLLSIPAIIGAGLLTLLDLIETGAGGNEVLLMGVAFLAAAATGYACIHWLLLWLRLRGLYGFAVYCALFAVVFLVIGN